jgi:hypothetical protein
LLLLEKKYADYADLAVETIAPLLTAIQKPQTANSNIVLDGPSVLDLVAMLSLVPLAAPEFCKQLPEAQVKRMAPSWESLRAKCTRDSTRKLVDAILLGMYQRLGKDQQRRAVAERMKLEPGNGLWPGSEPDVATAIKSLREEIRAMTERFPSS